MIPMELHNCYLPLPGLYTKEDFSSSAQSPFFLMRNLREESASGRELLCLWFKGFYTLMLGLLIFQSKA